MKTQLSQVGAFSRHASLKPIDALPDQFCLQLTSVLGTAKDPQAVNRNFEAFLSREDMLALRDLLNDVLAQ